MFCYIILTWGKYDNDNVNFNNLHRLIMTETPIWSNSLKLLSIKYITVYFLKLIFSLKISICFAYSFNMPSPRCILMILTLGILILPIINGENCAEKFTPWNADGGGNTLYLDRHRLNCGASSDVLRSFQLERLGNKIRYKYMCCNLPKGTCSLRSSKFLYSWWWRTLNLFRQATCILRSSWSAQWILVEKVQWIG